MSSRSVIATTGTCLTATENLRVLYDPAEDAARQGRFRSLEESSLCPALIDWLSDRFPQGLFTHQHLAIESVLSGQNTVAATRTSSGKSLIFSLPILHTLCETPESTALFLYPQKALANDQQLKLKSMADEIAGIGKHHIGNPYLISRYDGSTPGGQRSEIRERVQLMLTNPDMLHCGVMQHHERHWRRFFENLKLVAIDECHEYRGIFGTNVSHILHRLRQLCRYYGSDPRFIATSATVADPQQHMELLTGEPFHCVDAEQDGSLQGRRKFWMISGSDHYYDAGRKLAMKLADAGLTVLAFCPSRVAAERMLSRLTKTDEDTPHIRVYRSGLSTKEREEIECGLRDRSVRLVFSTSALELGIDIGEIDVVVCIGLPNSMMSLWQRAGRAARAGREGATVFVPSDSPIDTFYSLHPQQLFSRDNEPLALNRTNQRLLCQHYACAVQEMGGDDDRLNFDALGDEIRRIHELRNSGELDREEFYRADPHMEISIRGTGEGSYSLVVGNEEIGEIDSFHVLREVYRNAIYRHGGRSFRVNDVVRGKRLIRLLPLRTRNDTRPYIQKKIKLRQTMAAMDYSGVRVGHVRINVIESLQQVTEFDPAGKVIQRWPGSMGMAPHQLPTEGVMLMLRREFWSTLQQQMEGRPLGALESCERLLGGLFPTISGPCDTQDFSSATDTVGTGEPAIFLYDSVYDGVGLTAVAFHHLADLIDHALERLRNCECQDDAGCFSCIANPQKEEPASKSDTELLLKSLQGVLRSEQPRSQTLTKDWTDTLEQTGKLTCKQCDEHISTSDRFCSNCGFKLEA